MSNKDEALRAKDLAEDWMRKKDFTTARRVAIKARKMDASLEDVVSRMIMVCDVHCAVLEKSGDEVDWYKILQVEQNADENTIKKQYKKLAFCFHPDKNQLPGAEAAFKIIGEAQSVLLNKDRRRLHDIRRKPVKKPAPAASSSQPPKAPTTGSVPQQPQQAQRGFQTNVNTTWKRPEIQKKPQTQSTELGGGSSFWTSCAFCHLKSECSREHLNKQINCRRCGKQYAAFQENFPGPPVQSTFYFSQQSSKVPTQEAGKVAEKQPENTANVSSSKEGYRAKSWGISAENTNGLPAQATFHFPQPSSKVPTQEAGKVAEKQPENTANVSSSKEGYRAKCSGISAENNNGKRKRKNLVESSESSCSESSIECKKAPAGKQDSGTTGGQHSRRSVRRKQQISYNENKNDDDDKEEDAESAEESNVRKNLHENHLCAETLPNGKNKTKKIKAADQVGRSRDSSSGNASDAVIFECADPDFTNFEKLREATSFKAGQTWAMYDDIDRMPRFYANIKAVISKPFMLKIQWLEAKPDDEKAVQWVRKNLPISIGKFKLGGVENTNEAPSFSHLIHCSIGSNKDNVRVYPRIGETWALFKNWDITWSSGRRRSSHEHEYEYEYKYEFVEILSEYSQGVAIKVAFLRKVKGFASVFCRIALGAESDIFQIPPHELLRFSHRIPSTKLNGKERDLSGKERDGVPVGSYELDTAALPQKIEEEEEEGIPVLQEAAKSNQVHHRSLPSSDPDCVVIPNFDFHDFSAERLEGKFEYGQIWSLNSKEDGLPKCYVMIQKILWKPMFVLQINRLELESLTENVAKWQDKNMPVSCGNFRLNGGRVETLTKVTGFSHQIKVQVQQHFKENRYTVLPKTGEIWAMYKNWSVIMKATSLKKCEYEVVEILDETESYIEVLMLEKVKGFISVFKEKVEGGSDVKMTIPRWELMRFSHHVPAFRLTGENDGALRGCVELDSSALSRNLRRDL
ncbi:Chaperone protein dnaJ 49 [Cardamine amara subsp. amara]|uniref:Chaperone protein dnaJ 49 n=1 Tax=Cardamine amara subsp. amara TaxID=228776 RepID=A0ABD1AQP9_CARAN